MPQIIDGLLKERNSFRIRAEGISMTPFLESGDILYLKRAPFSKVIVNDLVIVKKGKNVFTHRVIYKRDKYLITKGDNNSNSDGKIYPYQLIGKVKEVKRNGQTFDPDNLYLFQSSGYFQEIVKIKKAFEKEKIKIVFLKGLPLHLYYEGSHPRRIYADCDILVDKKDRVKAVQILQNNGYHLGDYAITTVLERLKNRITELSYIKKIGGLQIIFDIHFDALTLINQFGELDNLYPTNNIEKLNEKFLHDKRYIEIQNQKFPILSKSDLIIYSVYNIFHHNFRGAFRLELLDEVIRRTLQLPSPLGNPWIPATPGVFLSLSKNIIKYQLQNFVYPVFLLLRKYYSTPLPAKFLDSIKPDENISYIKQNIMNINIFDDETRVAAGVTRFKNLFYLSPHPLWRRLMIIFNIQVIYSVFWVMIFFLRRSAIRFWKSFFT